MYLYFVIVATILNTMANGEVLQLPQALIERAEPVMKKCEAETNPPPGAFNKILLGEIEDDVTLKFAYCCLMNTKYITTEGLFNVEVAQRVVKEHKDKDKFTKALEDCNNSVKGNDHLEKLKALSVCYRDNSPLHFKM